MKFKALKLAEVDGSSQARPRSFGSPKAGRKRTG
jgi:hypothetical protein